LKRQEKTSIFEKVLPSGITNLQVKGAMERPSATTSAAPDSGK
jgi:hypothetical protein